ncbi:type II toxin-antitoxin system HipA family toxin [Undibacterium seohonense]|uniref:type II toxin-antitoxin system HipA family toxin n=1 Tax=Undibacterium seohonense TaxID=1344950 RepID=UPI001C9B9922
MPVGSFGLDEIGNGHFAYGRFYVDKEGAFALDPIHLKLSKERQEVPRQPDSSYGVLSDAGPNAWGVKLTASILKRNNQPLPANSIEWFLHSWHYGSGCIGFSQHHTEKPNLGVIACRLEDLSAKLQITIDELTINPDTKLTEEDIRLLAPGSSLGGFRPKTVVVHEGMEYIAKFSRPDDVFDVPSVEYATMRLAHKAGINTPDFELRNIANRPVFLIERFDRTKGGARKHYISAHSLLAPSALGIDKRELVTTFSYAGIAEAMRPFNILGQLDCHQLYRRMIFNIFIGNVDDHLRNHALLMESPGRYVLSPAFDIVPHSAAATTPQSIGVGAQGAASTTKNAISQCGRFLLKPDEANTIIEEVRAVISRWQQEFSDSGVTKRDIHILSSCIDFQR